MEILPIKCRLLKGISQYLLERNIPERGHSQRLQIELLEPRNLLAALTFDGGADLDARRPSVIAHYSDQPADSAQFLAAFDTGDAHNRVVRIANINGTQTLVTSNRIFGVGAPEFNRLEAVGLGKLGFVAIDQAAEGDKVRSDDSPVRALTRSNFASQYMRVRTLPPFSDPQTSQSTSAVTQGRWIRTARLAVITCPETRNCQFLCFESLS